MAILRFEAVRREIGTFVILDDVSAAVAHGERIGLVGINGAGKTTLLRLAAGSDTPDSGRVVRKAGLSVGLLSQEANLDGAFVAAPDLRAAVRAGAADLEADERELARLEAAGAEAVGSALYAEVRHRFEARDGYGLDQRVEATLSGLGFEAADLVRPPMSLSGGEQTRAALARLLIADPDLLLLDEPTNHLDVAAIEWLEQALARRDRAVIVASHDRAFLDAVVQRIWELRDRRLRLFRGAFSAYLTQREAADARAHKDAESHADAVAREQELVQRYRTHRKYAKMHEHERRLEALRATPVEAPKRRAALALSGKGLAGDAAVRSGDLVVSIRDAVVGFPAPPGDGAPIAIARAPRLEAQRGERIGIVGPNGAGKTTLLRTIAGDLAPLEGIVRLGAAVQPGYLAQLRQAAFTGQTVLDALVDSAPVQPAEARSYLARFLFRGDDAFKPVADLSGGERSRLELAVLGVSAANLLLLDEPTNHLDIPAREALETFLRQASATLLIVSHDRRLLESVCQRLWVVEAGRGGEPGWIVPFDGGWRAWRAAVADGWTVAGERELQARRLDGGRPAPRGADGARGAAPPSPAPQPVAAAVRSGRREPLSKDAYRRQRSVVDADLTRLGLRKTQLELALGRPDTQANFVELRRVASELADVDAALAQAEDAWLALEERAPR
ncbi:MAG TPA: ABC-F family ATP-binding cassette domain-containing protein [Candidatus Baltobacteraceae bacterium]|nr:ABC-F family ATP-binding cassette domain-containing protein [Candidatus Baltobacteraceae bacterium]